MNTMTSDPCRMLWEEYSGRGAIKVMAEVAGGALPIPGVEVKVEAVSEGNSCLIGEGVTDNSGIAEFIDIPALPQAASLQPMDDYAGVIYAVTVRHPLLGIHTANIAVFDGRKAVWHISPDIFAAENNYSRR